jgi:hypothetical protein
MRALFNTQAQRDEVISGTARTSAAALVCWRHTSNRLGGGNAWAK